MKCLETRRRDGMKWRRYRTDDGRIVTTYELPVTVLLGVAPMARYQARLQSWMRGEETRKRRMRVLSMIEQGIKPTAIAYEVGMTDTAIQKIKRNTKGLKT